MPSNQMDPPLPQQARRPFCFTTPSLLFSKQPMDILPNLRHHSILSMGRFCDAGCTVTFTNNDAIILNKEQVVLQEMQHCNGLWYLNTHSFKAHNRSHQQQSLNFITSVHTMKCLKHAIQFMYATLFSPTKATLLMSIKAGFLSS